jgi:hypothetical protein
VRSWVAVMLVVTSASAHADDEVNLAYVRAPGFVGDPIGELLARTLAVQTRAGYSLDGALPSEAQVWFDDFAVPGFHRDGRSAFTIDGLDSVSFGPQFLAPYGNTAGGLIELDSKRLRDAIAAASTRDAYALIGGPYNGLVLRTSLQGFAAPLFARADRVIDDAPNSQDLEYHGYWRGTPDSELDASAFATRDQIAVFTGHSEAADQRLEHLRDAGRAIIAYRYFATGWYASSQQSIADSDDKNVRGVEQHSLVNELSFDSRNDVRRAIRDLAGLYELRMELGFEAHVTRHSLDIAEPLDDRENIARAGEPSLEDVAHTYRGVIWTPDFAGSAGATAVLTERLSVYAGLRVDAFGSDVAIQPRAMISADLSRATVQLAAGAFRRGAEQGEELEHSDLHPERTTLVQLTVRRDEALFYQAIAYYADRTNLIERDTNNLLANTGNGTTYGVYGLVGRHLGHWIGQLAIRLEHDDRQAAPRGLVRAFEYSQPVRLEARLTRFVGHWQFGARFELREGLPYTQVIGNDYNSDSDSYTAQFGPLYAERLPWHHQLDLRVDHKWQHWSVFLDIANVYDDRSAIGYAYNYNFTERRAIQGRPIIPTIGVRGEL